MPDLLKLPPGCWNEYRLLFVRDILLAIPARGFVMLDCKVSILPGPANICIHREPPAVGHR